MTIFTEGLIQRQGRNILDDVATGQFDAAEAAFDDAWFNNPTTAARRINELRTAEQGEIVQNEMTVRGYTVPEVRVEAGTPMLTPEDARAQVKESGLDIKIPDTGIRQGALDILVERNREQRERQLVLDNAPASTVPIQLLAGFGASALDPINIASAFIPVVGEARYASLLANATSRAARFGVRARVGALQGAVGAAVVEPLPLLAAQQDQTDYGMSDTLLNIAFGGVLGGGLHGVGGLISDVRRGNVLSDTVAQVAAESAPGVTVRRSPLSRALETGDDDPMVALRESLERGIEQDRVQIAANARRQAQEELAPVIREELQAMAAGRVSGISSLREESQAIDGRIAGLDGNEPSLQAYYRDQGMDADQAAAAARGSINEQRMQLVQRKEEVDQVLAGNDRAEFAQREIARLERGELPDQFANRVFDRADQIAAGFDIRPSFRAVAEASPWYTRQAALKSAVAQSVTGREIDVEALFDLNDPLRRADAMDRLKQPPKPRVNAEGEAASAQADEAMRFADESELDAADRMLADEQALTDEMAAQADLDITPYTREADELIRDADVYAAAYRAAGICQLRN